MEHWGKMNCWSIIKEIDNENNDGEWIGKKVKKRYRNDVVNGEKGTPVECATDGGWKITAEEGDKDCHLSPTNLIAEEF